LGNILVFKPEVYDKKAHILENINKIHKSRNVSTPLDSQTALKALDFVQIDSQCTWNSLQLSCTCGM